MPQIKGPTGVFSAHGADADYWLAQPGYARVVTEAEAEATAEQLKGERLDTELRDLGLPLTGTADEKRDRLAAALTNPLED